MNPISQGGNDMTKTETGTSGRIRLALATALVAVLAMLSIAQAASAVVFEGPVLSKDSESKTFRMNPENHSNVTIKVTNSTKFQRIDGFGGLHKGLDVEAKVVKQGGDWIAQRVEKHKGGGGGGDDR
jgi:hypothetical protein